jgi:MFS transporter, DHA1 family, tetracycline resistance protein
MDKRLKIIYLIVFVDIIVGTMLSPVLPKMVKGLEAPQFWLGLSTALFTGIQLFSAPILGVMADRLGRRPLFLLAAVGTLFFNLMLLPQRWWALYISRAGDGLTNGIHTAIRAAVTDISKPEDLYKNMGTEGSIASLGVVIGPAVTGSILIWFNLSEEQQLPVIIAIALCLAVFNIGLCWILPEMHPNLPANARIDWQEVKMLLYRSLNIKSLYKRLKQKSEKNPNLLILIQMQMLVTLCLGYYWYYVNYLTLGNLQFSGEQVAYNFMFFGLLNAGTSLIFFRFFAERINKRTAILVCSAVGVLVLLAYAQATTHLEIYLICIIDCLTISYIMGVIDGLIGKETNDEDRGEVFGIAQGLNAVANFFTTFICSGLSLISPELPFYWFALCLSAVFVLGLKMRV